MRIFNKNFPIHSRRHIFFILRLIQITILCSIRIQATAADSLSLIVALSSRDQCLNRPIVTDWHPTGCQIGTKSLFSHHLSYDSFLFLLIYYIYWTISGTVILMKAITTVSQTKALIEISFIRAIAEFINYQRAMLKLYTCINSRQGNFNCFQIYLNHL